MNPNDPNVELLEVVASHLGAELLGELVFVGGAADREPAADLSACATPITQRCRKPTSPRAGPDRPMT